MENMKKNEKALQGIHCDVKTCYYNHASSKCTAEHIDVANPAAKTAAETACATFKNR